MSRSRTLLVGGAVVSAALVALLVVGAVSARWWLVALTGGALAAAILLVQLDTWRRTRSLRSYLRDEIRGQGASAPTEVFRSTGPTVTQEDVVGAVRLMQAQYTGRMDRMQNALDQALAALASSRRDDPER